MCLTTGESQVPQLPWMSLPEQVGWGPDNTTGCRSLSGCVVMGASWLMRPRHHALGQTARKQQFISRLIAKVIVPIRPNYFWLDQQSWRAAENLISIKLVKQSKFLIKKLLGFIFWLLQCLSAPRKIRLLFVLCSPSPKVLSQTQEQAFSVVLFLPRFSNWLESSVVVWVGEPD